MLILCSCHKDHQVAAPGEQSVDVYVYGSLWHGTSTSAPTSADAVYYKNGIQVILNDGGIAEPSTYVLTVNSLAVSNDTVYAGGSSTNNSYVSGSTLPIGPVYWINGAEHVLQITNTISPIILGTAANGKNFYNLYRGEPFTGGNAGNFFKLSGVAINGIMKYGYDDELSGLLISGTDLYAYGSTFGGDNAIYYKNNQPVKFQLPANTAVASITGMYISGQDVYACGFLVNNDSLVPVYWKNGILTMLTGTNLYTTGIAVQGGNIYISGYQENVTNSNGLPTKEAVLWKNGVMTTLTASPGFDSYTNGVVVSGNDVYVSGRAGSDSDCTVYWKNGTPVNFKIPTGYAFVNKGITIVPKKE